MEPGQHPNSKPNLVLGRWQPGQSGNPSGRARGHVYPSELLSGLLSLNDDGSGKYKEADIEAILKDPDAPLPLKLACRWIVTGLKSGERWVLGKDGQLKPAALDPTPLKALESLADRQEGKPMLKVQVQDAPLPTPQECQEAIAETIESHPELLDSPGVWPSLEKIIRQRGPLLERLRPLLLQHVPTMLESVEDEPRLPATL